MNEDGYFGEHVAANYDQHHNAMFDPSVVDPAVDFLYDLAGQGNALEFAIGTGRIALPLAQRGVTVHGIELSRAMVSRLTAKPHGSDLPVTIGDIAQTSTGELYSVVYLVFNTIMNLTTQAEQVACFRNAAAHLQPSGCFVIEVMVPNLPALASDQGFHAHDITETHWGIDEYNVETQGLISHHIRSIDGETTHSQSPFRYVWPMELDLMAQLAGMQLKERWADWKRESFKGKSQSHVSVWEKPLA